MESGDFGLILILTRHFVLEITTFSHVHYVGVCCVFAEKQPNLGHLYPEPETNYESEGIQPIG